MAWIAERLCFGRTQQTNVARRLLLGGQVGGELIWSEAEVVACAGVDGQLKRAGQRVFVAVLFEGGGGCRQHCRGEIVCVSPLHGRQCSWS